MNTMKRRIAIVCCLAAVLLVQCRQKKQSSADVAPEATAQAKTPSASPTVQELVVSKQYEWTDKSDPFSLVSVRIDGDTLFAEVSYSGGCRDHAFKLSTTGAWMKSLPPQMEVWLEHNANEDNCRAVLTETLKFDIRKARYQASEEVVIILNGDRERRVMYRY